MDKVQKIRAEVERLYNQSLADENRQADRGLERAANVSYGKLKACKELLSFIDTLQEEPVSDDFEKVLEDKIRDAQCWTYIEEEGCECPIFQEFGADYLEKFARWGAQWQKEKEYTCYEEAFEDGAKWKKEQMMKDAITARCFGFQSPDALFSIHLPAKGYLVGHELRVIIVKED